MRYIYIPYSRLFSRHENYNVCGFRGLTLELQNFSASKILESLFTSGDELSSFFVDAYRLAILGTILLKNALVVT